MSLEWQSPTPCLGSVTQSRVFSSSESVCRCYIIIVSSHAARTTQVEDSDSDDGQHDMDSDDVGQPEINYSVLYYPLFLSLPLSFPPSLPSLSLSLLPSLSLSPSLQEVDYGSGDEMEEDDGDMFVDEDLDLQARSVNLCPLLLLQFFLVYLVILRRLVAMLV